MNIQTKTQIARLTLSLLTYAAFLFLLGILVLVLCAGLSINPFKETTTAFLISSFLGLIGIGTMLVLLNLATNISLIADAKIAEMKIESDGRILKKWGIALLAATILFVGIIFIGTYLSRERHLSVVRSQADEVLKENGEFLDRIGPLLASGNKEDYKKVQEIRKFLENQRSGLPHLTLIYSAAFDRKTALYKIEDSFFSDKGDIERKYFRCTQSIDCGYLQNFFSGKDPGILQGYTLHSDQFYIYIPHTGPTGRFVLLFERRNSYGKLGS